MGRTRSALGEMTARQARRTLYLGAAIMALPWLLLSILAAATFRVFDARKRKPRLLWGARPVKSLTYLSAAARQAGYRSETAVIEMSRISDRVDFDHVLSGEFRGSHVVAHLLYTIKACAFFSRALMKYDVFHYFFDGGVLQWTAYAWLEIPVLRLCGKRVVLMPYGSDSFVYDRLNPLWQHALLSSYPDLAGRSGRIQRRLRWYSSHADLVVGCLVHFSCLPRWDVLPLLYYPIDVKSLKPVPPRTEDTVRIAHAPNHRGVKGTEFIIEAVRRLRQEGHDLELVLLEGQPNYAVLETVSRVDIFVDQLVFGYALAAIEAMALGKVVVTGVEPDMPEYRIFRRYSYLDECPMTYAGPETIYRTLLDLILRRSEWPEMGRRCRDFVERRHSFEATNLMWSAIYRRIWDGEDVDLMNLYHPIFAMPPGADGRDEQGTNSRDAVLPLLEGTSC